MREEKEKRKVGRHKKIIEQDPWEILPNPQYEQFAHCRAVGMSQRAAAIEAGYSKNGAAVNGSKLEQRPAINKRILYLRERSNELAVESVGLTKAEILRKLGEISQTAFRNRDFSAANRALELIGKQLGMFVERKVIGIQALIAELTPDNLRLAKPDELLRLVESVDSALLQLPSTTDDSIS